MPLDSQKIHADSITPAVWRVVAVAILGSFVSTLDATVVNVSLSSLAKELHSTLGVIEWVASGYMLALALMLPLSGWLVDRIGARTVYIWCFSAFTLSSALCGLAWSADSLIGFRVLQGMAGGLLAPMAQMMMAHVAGRHMVRIMGYAALSIMLGPILGPVIAGAILQNSTWRWLFYVNLPFGILAVLLSFLFLPKDSHETTPRKLDFVGFVLLSPGLVAFLYALDHINEPNALYTLGLAILLLGSFFFSAIKKGPRALMNLGLFRGKVFSAATLTQFLVNGVNLSFQVLVPLYLIDGCHVSPQRAGYLLLPMGIGMMCMYPMVGRLTNRFGIRMVSATGAVVAVLGTLPFIYFGRRLLIVPMLTMLFIRGIGYGAIGIPSMSAAYSVVPKKELPMAATTLNILQRLGGPIMTTAVTTIIVWKAANGSRFFTFPFSAGFSFLAAIHFVLLLAALRLPMRLEHVGEVEEEVAQEAFEA
jgi:EmrB/QacA subfamily drug resistance transporter